MCWHGANKLGAARGRARLRELGRGAEGPLRQALKREPTPEQSTRIEALLAANPVQTPGSSAAIQADTLSLIAQRLVPLMTGAVTQNAVTREVVELLRGWDFRMDMDKVGPLLFTAWLRQLSRSILFGRFGNAVSDYWDLRPSVMESVLTRRREWCDDPKRPGEERCATRLAEALKTALARLRRDYGDEMTKWQWGRAHVAVFANPVFSRIPVLRDWLGVSIPTPGAYDTLNRGPSTIREEATPFKQRFGAGLRSFLFEPNVPATHRLIEERIQFALRRWEPRISLDAVVVRPHPDDPARAVVAITYALVATQARDGIELSVPVGGGLST